jgi:hypothetical protein
MRTTGVEVTSQRCRIGRPPEVAVSMTARVNALLEN